MDWDDLGNDYRNNGDKMNRKDWEFEYTAKELANAAELKRNHRESRVEWWEKKRDEVMLEVKETGLEVNESLANSYTSSAGRGPQVMVRADLQTKLMECHDRIQKHMSAVREYDGWVQVLDAQDPHNKMKLKHADWLFFFGRD
jgi:pyridoxine/pyridoxamine 5'-phosphate oxidase